MTARVEVGSLPRGLDVSFTDVASQALSAVVVCRLERPDDPASFRVVFMNEATETVVRPGLRELVGQPLFDVFPNVNRTHFARLATDVLSEHQARRTGDFPYEVAGRGKRLFALELVPVASDVVAVFAEDVTELRAAEQALRSLKERLEATLAELQRTQERLLQAERMGAVGALAAGIAHEVNNPIGALTSSVEVARRASSRLRNATSEKEGWSVSARAERLLGAVEKSAASATEAATRIARLVRRIGQLAEPSGEATRCKDLTPVVEQALARLERETGRRVQVTVQVPELPEMPCHPEDLARLLFILLQNASEHTSAEGRVTLEGVVAPDHVDLLVCDEGPGMTEDDVRSSRAPSFGSDGTRVHLRLGLQIAEAIAQRHGGYLEIDSRPGAGTTVRVRLPRPRE